MTLNELAIDDQMRTLLRMWAAYAENVKRDKALDKLYVTTRSLLGDISMREHQEPDTQSDAA